MVNIVSSRERSTKGQSRQLRPGEIELIRRTHGMAAKIARQARLSKGYVANVLAGRRPASEKFLIAMQAVMLDDAQDRTTVAMLSGLPEPDSRKGTEAQSIGAR